MTTTWLLIAVVFSVLLVGTAAGEEMRRRHPGDPVVRDWNARADSWWGMTVILGLALLGGFWVVLFLFAFLSFAALREFVTIAHLDRSDHFAWAAVIFVILPVQYAMIAAELPRVYSLFIPVYGLVLVPVVSVVTGQTKRFLRRVGSLQMAMMVCIYGVSHIPALATLPLPGGTRDGLFLIAFLAIVTQGATTLQHLFGRLYGRTPIAPALSAKKTWEGFIGGILSAGLLGGLFSWITPFSPAAAAGLAFVATSLGLLAGLVMSAIKRDAGIRDWGHSLPGEGGFLDRLDPVVFAAPVFYHLVRYGWAS